MNWQLSLPTLSAPCRGLPLIMYSISNSIFNPLHSNQSESSHLVFSYSPDDVMIFAGFAMVSKWSFAGVPLSMWAPSRSAGGRISHRAIPVPARPTTIASSGMVSQMSLMSFVLIESLPPSLPLSRTDTQKSILYACPGSPKSHRVSHCGKSERRRRLLMATINASPSSSPSPFQVCYAMLARGRASIRRGCIVTRCRHSSCAAIVPPISRR